MWDARCLGWVVHNRGIKSRAEPVSAPAQRVLGRIERWKTAVENPIPVAIAKVADGEFMDQCTPGLLKNGVLTIFVRDERLVCSYRLSWTLHLLEALGKWCPQYGVRGVRFVKAVTSPSSGGGNKYTAPRG